MEGPLDSCLLDAGAVRKTDGLSLTDQGIVVAQPQKQARSEKRQGDRLRARAPRGALARLPQSDPCRDVRISAAHPS